MIATKCGRSQTSTAHRFFLHTNGIIKRCTWTKCEWLKSSWVLTAKRTQQNCSDPNPKSPGEQIRNDKWIGYWKCLRKCKIVNTGVSKKKTNKKNLLSIKKQQLWHFPCGCSPLRPKFQIVRIVNLSNETVRVLTQETPFRCAGRLSHTHTRTQPHSHRGMTR